uniref:Uncharacterized protein n=1 Tax=Arundo donax TaxID=35708 RepID=A0A0A9BVH9_ARUDO
MQKVLRIKIYINVRGFGTLLCNKLENFLVTQ